MGIISSLFGSDENAGKLVDGAKHAVDKMFYTDEEKADASRTGFELWIEYQKATQPQNRSRRALALSVGLLWWVSAFILLVGVVLDFDYVARLSDYMETVINKVYMLVMVFYFVKRLKS